MKKRYWDEKQKSNNFCKYQINSLKRIKFWTDPARLRADSCRQLIHNLGLRLSITPGSNE